LSLMLLLFISTSVFISHSVFVVLVTAAVLLSVWIMNREMCEEFIYLY